MVTWLVLIGAGLIAGLFGTVTGVGSVFSYPVLLAIGLPPTSANVTNTVGLAIGGVGGAYSSRPELVGRRRVTVRLCAASAVGTVAGSALLLLSPPHVFALVVPFLVAAASVSILLPRPRPHDDRSAPNQAGGMASLGVMALVSVYNGYFAAGSAVLMIAALMLTTTLSLPIANGLKNVLVLVSDVIAALVFAIFGPVDWALVPPLAIGLFVGSLIGPALARRMPVARLRVLIAVLGMGLAVSLGIQAF